MKLQEKEKKDEKHTGKAVCMSSGMQSDDLNVFQVTFHS